jgi:hypothetical protein
MVGGAFREGITSSSWASLDTPARSAMKRSFRAGVVALKERHTDDQLELTKSPPSQAKWLRAGCRVGVQRWNWKKKRPIPILFIP